MITELQALQLLRNAAAVSAQVVLADQLDISQQYLSDVLRGRRDPVRVLERFGLRRVVGYEPVKPGVRR